MKHWLLAGSHPKDYITGIDDTITYDGKKAAYLRSNADQPSGFGTLMQTFNANRYRKQTHALHRRREVGGSQRMGWLMDAR
jgi:hypothetical protein